LRARTLRVTGTLESVERVFGVRLMNYAHASGNYRGRSGPIQVPAEIFPYVVGVYGLDTRRVARRHRHKVTERRIVGRKAASSRTADGSYFFPGELARLYNFPAGDAAGQSVALLEFGGGYFAEDLAEFCKDAGIVVPEVLARSVDGTPVDARDGAEGEVMLDVEVVAGAAPGAKIALYFSSFTEQGWIDALDAVVHDAANAASVLSVSWGDSEDGASWSFSGIEQVNEALQEAALLGITVCVAAGDDGSDDQVGDGYAHVDFPASSPFVLAVGGTTLTAKGTTIEKEVAWRDGDGLRSSGGGSTGGGVSIVFDVPVWQGGVSVASVNPGVKPGRIVPDLAADASASTGYYVVVDGEGYASGGTSASAPLVASLLALCSARIGRSVGFVTPRLYADAAGASVCRDITSGTNATAALGGYSAQAGFDAVTGWGVPDGEKLLALLSPPAPAQPAAAAEPRPGPVA